VEGEIQFDAPASAIAEKSISFSLIHPLLRNS
jgi:hypothetical protein